ncbi:MAG: POT family MFS transporter [Verrucomicrobiota bacterium]
MNADPAAQRFVEEAARSGYATAPVKTTRMPPGIPYIVGNEAAERFSFYGMSGILTTFLAHHLQDASGHPAPMSAAGAVETYHLFVSAVYFTPLLGALISDAFWGKYRTILYLSMVYCCGHLALALDSTRLGLAVGLTLIAFGAGGIKPCVSANVGDQFGAGNQHLLAKVFGWFYFAINLGAGLSQLWIPNLLEKSGPHVAFAAPGVLMLAATVVFWLGRRKFAHIPPRRETLLKEAFSPEGWRILARLGVLYIFLGIYFSLYFQSQSAWVLQADKMDRHWLGHEWLSAQLQSINPILVLVFIPLFSYGVYPLAGRVFPLTPLRKISIGLFLMVPTFLITAWIEHQIALGSHPNVAWQGAAYVLLTASEILVSITALEFSYTQAPRKMKSLIMAYFFLAMSLGNLFTSIVNKLNEGRQGPLLSGVNYYLFFTGLMLAASVVFVFVAARFQVRNIIQDDAPAPA